MEHESAREVLCVFFFQAEDGIRDYKVTGVQTCALPIYFDRVAAEAVRRNVWMEINASPERLDLHGVLIRGAKAKGAKFTISTDAHHPKRSEERRVGKECRSRWSPYH